jgi:outer membrane cobalamin receptor
MVLLNGMRVESDAIGTLPIETISFIDIIRLPQASIYGSGWNLVIAVFTKTFEDYRDADIGHTRIVKL